MLPLVPSSRLLTSQSFTDFIHIYEKDGRRAFFHGEGNSVCELMLDRRGDGFLDDGIVYSLTFRDCTFDRVTRVHVANIIATFGPTFFKGPQFQKVCGETIFDYKNAETSFCLNKEETLALVPLGVTKVPIKFQVVLKSVYGNRSRRVPIYDFYEKNAESTLALVFADTKTIYANLTLLSIHSQFFKTLYEHLDDLPKDANSGLPLLKLKDFNSRIFSRILHLIYPSVDDGNLYNSREISETLRLADYLSLETILVRYEKLLNEDSDNFLASPCQKLLWSVQYAMGSLQYFVIGQLKKIREVKKMRRDPKFQDLPKEVVEMVLDKLLELVKKGGKYEDQSEDESRSGSDGNDD